MRFGSEKINKNPEPRLFVERSERSSQIREFNYFIKRIKLNQSFTNHRASRFLNGVGGSGDVRLTRDIDKIS